MHHAADILNQLTWLGYRVRVEPVEGGIQMQATPAEQPGQTLTARVDGADTPDAHDRCAAALKQLVEHDLQH